jgi:hypothetical protein
MRPQTPLELCTQIARDHAANTISAIAEQRTATLAARLQTHANTLIELADQSEYPTLSSEREPDQPGDRRS